MVNAMIFNWCVWEVAYDRLLTRMSLNLGQCVKFIFTNTKYFCYGFKMSDR